MSNVSVQVIITSLTDPSKVFIFTPSLDENGNYTVNIDYDLIPEGDYSVRSIATDLFGNEDVFSFDSKISNDCLNGTVRSGAISLIGNSIYSITILMFILSTTILFERKSN